jgi:nucleotide-binding universal stress UspA family protein
MLKIRRVLHATDQSDASIQAAVFATEIARRFRAELHLVTTEIVHMPRESGDLDEDLLLGWTRDAVGDLADTAPIEAARVAVLRDVAAAPAIVAYTQDHDIDLVVLGTHGRRGLRRAFMGSVAEEVLRSSPSPVLSVRSMKEPPHPVRMRSILVPTDFSEHADSALMHAVRFARGFEGAHLHILHVISESLHPAFYNTGVFSIYDVEPDIEKRSVEELQKHYDALGVSDVPATMHAVGGNPAEEIIRFAEENDMDLIVTGTHGRSGIERFFMGSVADKVNRRAPCPVLTTRSFGRSLLDS